MQVLAVLLLALVAIAQSGRVPFIDRVHQHGWTVAKTAVSAETTADFIVHLRQQKLDELDDFFWKVSDPKHQLFRQYKTMKELDEMTRPKEEAFEVVRQWLTSLEQGTVTEGPNYFHVVTDARSASKLLNTELRTWTHHHTQTSLVSTFGEASVPVDVHEHVHLVSGLSHLFVPKKSLKVHDVKGRQDYWNGFNSTLANLRKAYNITNTKGSHPKTSQAILAFDDFFSLEGLHFYQKTYGLPQAEPIAVGHNCLNNTPPCDEYESDLDVQYMMGLAQGVRTYFVGNPPNYWVLEAFTLSLRNLTEQPQVVSISYGSLEVYNCPGAYLCSNSTDASKAYVDASDVLLKKYGASGTTVLVSSGDDGTNNFPNADGNCPLTNVPSYCPDGGCEYNSSKCQQVLITVNGTFVVFPNSNSNSINSSALAAQFMIDNAKCAVDVDNTSQSLYSNCTCAQLVYKTYSVGNQSVAFSQYSWQPRYGQTFTPSWPASSPYVTSVGATLIWAFGNETAASTTHGAVISSGGGFSGIYPRPAYQTPAINRWGVVDRRKPPAGSYDSTFRGFPDVSLSGHAYPVATSKDVIRNFDGTSCSSPAFAAFISLINDRLHQKNQTSLGFINPLLYQVPRATYFDIREGDTKCGEKQCCEYGFFAAPGWDATTGLGSVNYGNLESFVLSGNSTSTTTTTSPATTGTTTTGTAKSTATTVPPSNTTGGPTRGPTVGPTSPTRTGDAHVMSAALLLVAIIAFAI